MPDQSFHHCHMALGYSKVQWGQIDIITRVNLAARLDKIEKYMFVVINVPRKSHMIGEKSDKVHVVVESSYVQCCVSIILFQADMLRIISQHLFQTSGM